ncbi:MAG: hypothetical protein AAF639_08330 [Chloroflexota bacterium]
MNLFGLWQRWWWLVTLVGAVAIWLAPIDGQVMVTTSDDTGWVWPQIQVNPSLPEAGETVTVWVTDVKPWSHVMLTVNDSAAGWVETTANPAETWTWQFEFIAPDVADGQGYALTFYHDCHTGCQQRTQTAIGPYAPDADSLKQVLRPTKLGLVFPNPERDWHGRQGWGVELTYAVLADDPTWDIDRLAQRVAAHHSKGVRMLIRVDYAPQQSLPPVDDEIALSQYLTYLQRLANDDRLRDVYGYIIGTCYNEIASNRLSPESLTTPAWYARVFNGYGQDVTHTDNAVQVMRAANDRARLLVGPLQPWNEEQNGDYPYAIDVPWLNYMNTLVRYLDEATLARQTAGIPLSGPDGFAIQAPGNPTAPELGETPASQEPLLDLPRATWQGAQVGFSVYRDWIAIINDYETTQNLPIYISSTNTYIPSQGIPPAQNYPAGWLTNALDVVNQNPQIVALIWFMDDLPGDEQWQWFSLRQGSGRLIEAAGEFEGLLLE